MSMYFFRLHNLRRQEEDKKRRQRRLRCNRYANAALTLAPSRLFERPPLTPSDSLDEVAFQIPRCSPYVNIITRFIINVSHTNALLFIRERENSRDRIFGTLKPPNSKQKVDCMFVNIVDSLNNVGLRFGYE